MRFWGNDQTNLFWGRLVGLVGVALTLAGLALFVLFSTTTGRSVPGELEHVFAIQVVCSLLALLGVLVSRWPFLSVLALGVTFVGAFFGGAGFYLMLYLDTPFTLVGVGNLLYWLAAVLLYGAMGARQSRR